jgi:sorting nexin-4
MDNDFDNVSWGIEQEEGNSRPNTAGRSDADGRSFRPLSRGRRRISDSANQAGHTADRVDLGGIGDGRLECTVEAPLKENDGTKDAYVSYLVTTHVCFKFRARKDA